MEEKENMKTNALKLQIGDYVYLQCQPTGAGRKFKPIFEDVVHFPMVFLSAPELLNVRPTFCVVVHTPLDSDVQMPA
jgi:hypothetical protein